MKKAALLVAAFLIVFSSSVFAQKQSLAKANSAKLKRAAELLSTEVTARGFKSVSVEDFTDIKKRPLKTGKEVAEEFRKHLSSGAGGRFTVVTGEADSVFKGTLIPFEGRKKWQIKIRLHSKDGSVITAYEGILLRK